MSYFAFYACHLTLCACYLTLHACYTQHFMRAAQHSRVYTGAPCRITDSPRLFV